MMTRRALLGAGAGVAAAAALNTRAGSAIAASGRSATVTPYVPILPPDRIGLQLYSVRDEVSRVGFGPVLASLARMGYKVVEFAGYSPSTPAQLRNLLNANGLKAVGSHVSPSNDASMSKILDDAQTIGIPNVGISFEVPSGLTVSAWQALADQWNHYGEMAAKRNVGFYFHNHFQEFATCLDNPSKRGIDVLLAETDPRYVFWEMDIYWAYVGMFQSGNAFDPLKNYAIPFRKRIKLFHVKDGAKNEAGNYDIVDVGEGSIDFSAFFSKLFAAGGTTEKTAHQYLWERDNASDHPRGPMASAQASFANVRYSIQQR